MTKKKVGVYMQNIDIEWVEQNPIADSISGCALFSIEWAIRQFQRGQVTALEKIDETERQAIVRFVSSLEITADFSPAMLSIGLRDWFRYNNYTDWHGDDEKTEKLIKTCEELSPAEVIGLLAWARKTARGS